MELSLDLPKLILLKNVNYQHKRQYPTEHTSLNKLIMKKDFGWTTTFHINHRHL